MCALRKFLVIRAAVAATALAACLCGRALGADEAGGLRVWASDINDQTDGPAAGDSSAIRIVAARNGTFSGKAGVSAGRAIKGLNATCGDLRSASGETRDAAGVIPASQVQIRYGLLWTVRKVRQTPRACLSESPAAEYPAASGDAAAASVWVTVKVPASAKPGEYKGELSISADGAKPAKLPIRLQVTEWTLPAPNHYVSWVDIIEAPDTSAVEANLPLWSPKHWDMVGRSLSLLGGVGNRTLYIPLIAHTNLGNEETMVRWIEKGDEKFDFDFSVMDKYLDLAEKCMGKPEVVVIEAWELYMLPAEQAQTDEEIRSTYKGEARGRRIVQGRQAQNIKEKGGKLGLGPQVTAVDPKTGKTECVSLPPYTDDATKALWAPLMKEVRARLEKRGLGKAMMIGMCSDAWASKEEVALFKEWSGGAPWVIQSHYGFPIESGLLHGLSPVGYQTRVWGGIRFADGLKQTNQSLPPSAESCHGWSGPDRIAVFERNAGLDTYPIARWRFYVETCVTSTARGAGRLGADFWPAVRNKQGERAAPVQARFPESHWRNLNICSAILAPSPEGPAATDRYEAFREGLEDCEARIVLERALLDPARKAKLGADLAKKAQDTLDERLKAMWNSLGSNPGSPPTNWRWGPGYAGQAWLLKSGWQDRSAKLFTMAAEVEKRLGAGK